MYSKASTFYRIHVEEGIRDHPRTLAVLERFPRSVVVVIDDYQNVFGRGRQDFWRQKAGPTLILARKKENFLYPGNEYLQGSRLPNFHYNTLVMNCPYDCHYCYLQGMYSGANIVAFVNLEDFLAAAAEAVQERGDKGAPLHLAVSHDTDLLALEGILGYAAAWNGWARHREDVLIEIRTKSAPYRFLRSVDPAAGVRLAWTLTPGDLARRYETGAPGLEARVRALREAAGRGWRIAVCIDPILKVPGEGDPYGDFVDFLGRELPWQAVERIELGVFRVSAAYFKRMRKRPGTDLLHYPYLHANNTVSYFEEERVELMGSVRSRLLNFISKEKIILWT
ncbi:MAG: SPL family radical SAM protein [Oceanipulchritudo sp.]